ncbi:MAG: hypothetical protein HY710_06075, partial [Candidatus Latescibacteria bacterium]|nr:hypothetical protein [Candidatus Latescibacterota bacterium]
MTSSILRHLHVILLLAATWCGCYLLYPTVQLWTMTPDEVNRLPPSDRAALMRRAIVPGLDLRGGFSLRLIVDTSKWSERGQQVMVKQVIDLIRARLTAIGIIEPGLRRQGGHDIIVDVPLSADTTQIGFLVSHPGRLTFQLLKSGTDVQALRQRIDAVLTTRAAADTTRPPARPAASPPFSGLLASLVIDEGIEDIVVAETAVPQVKTLLADSTVQAELRAFNRSHPPAGEFVWPRKPVVQAGQQFYPLYFVKQEPDLIGTPLASARVNQASGAMAARVPYVVEIQLNDDGRQTLTSLSSANVGRRLAISVDGGVYTTLTIQGKIPDGRAIIPAGNTLEEASVLATVLQSGVFPVTVATVHTEPIGPTTQGHTTAVRPGAYAAGLALVLAGLFLIVVYRVAGAVAVVGLLFDLVMTGACLRLWKIAGIHPLLTLSGLIGCGLGIGLVLGSHI